MRRGYAVTVFKDGEAILTVERSMLAGNADLSDADQDAIRDAGEHLLAFVGPEICSVCGVRRKCDDACPSRDIPF